ncbi:MAG: beta-lactamase family protein, partial [Oscillochloris sp.]|nr:beta-lactamase family protein [Oscillochloris sp.]
MSRRTLQRNLLPLLICILLAALPSAPARAAQPTAPALEPSLVAELDGMLEATRSSARAPGALLAIALPNGEVYRGASGLADLATGAPLAPDARVRVASVTKTFVATIALQLVQEGWLRLDHSVEHWLPGMISGGDQITVRQLLNHTSGLPDYLTESIIARAHQDPAHQWAPQ